MMKNKYDPVREMYDAMESQDIALDYVFMLYGAEREAVRVLKHGMSDGKLALYEMLGPVKRYLDAWELDEVVRNIKKNKAGADKIKDVFVSITKKGLRREK